MKKIIAMLLIFVVIVGALLFLSPYSEMILGTENFADDILAFIYDFTSDTNFKPGHTCAFDKQDTDSKYRAAVANCTQPAQYYYSCECGAKGSEKFASGEPKGHSNELIIEGDYRTSYLIGETFDSTGMTAVIYCPDCENSEAVENLTVPATEPFTHSTDHKTITVSAEGYSVDVYYRAMDYAVTNVELKADENSGKAYYVVSGRYAEGFNISDLFFSLADSEKVYWSNGKTSDRLNVEVNETERTFKMSLDVTEISAQHNYTPYYYGNKTEGTNLITDYTGKYDGMQLKVDNTIYTISHKMNLENMETYGVPVLYKTLDLFGPKYEATSANLELDETNGKVYYVVSGTSNGYTTAIELKTDIQFYMLNNSVSYLTHDFIEVFEYNSENGKYTFKIDITGLSENKYPYYTRFGESDRRGDVPDFKGIKKANVDTSPIRYNGRLYQIVYGTNTKKDGYATVAVRVSVDDGIKFTANSINLELDEVNSKVYYVVSGTSEGYASLEKLAADIKITVGNATEANLTVTAFDAATGAFTFKVDITDSVISPKGQPTKIARQSDPLKYLDYIDAANVDTATVITLGDKNYQLFYVPGGTAENEGYGAVCIKVAAASQIATSVYLAVDGTKVYYVIEGHSIKYTTKEELIADFKIQIRNIPVGGKAKTYLDESNVIVDSFDATTGLFTLKINITNLANNSNPYYTRIGNAVGVSDFNYLGTDAVNTTTVILNGKTYSIVYVPNSTNAAEGYGTISVKVVTE